MCGEVPTAGRVAHWTWDEATCRSLADLRALRDGGDHSRHVLRLTIDMRVPAAEYEEAEAILRELKGTDALHGRVGVLQLDRSRLALDSAHIDDAFAELPDVLRAAAARLKALEHGDGAEIAQQALMHLYRSVRQAS